MGAEQEDRSAKMRVRYAGCKERPRSRSSQGGALRAAFSKGPPCPQGDLGSAISDLRSWVWDMRSRICDLGPGVLAWAHAPLPLLLAVARASWASLGQCDAAECSAAIAVRICGECGCARDGALPDSPIRTTTPARHDSKRR